MKVKVYFEAFYIFTNFPDYVLTKEKKVINVKTNRLIKKTKSGGYVGFNIDGNFFKLSDINKHIKIIPKKEKLPF